MTKNLGETSDNKLCNIILILDKIFIYLDNIGPILTLNKTIYNFVDIHIKKHPIRMRLDYLNNNMPYQPDIYDLHQLYNIATTNIGVFGIDSNRFLNKFVNSSGFYDNFLDYCKIEELYNLLIEDVAHFYISGGSILYCSTNDGFTLDNSDIDIFCITDDPLYTYEHLHKDIILYIERLCKYFPEIIIEDADKTITLVHPEFRKIQFVKYIYKSVNHLFSFFDIDCVKFAYKNNKIYTTLDTIISVVDSIIFMEWHYTGNIIENMRCIKYTKKKFKVVIRKITHFNTFYYFVNGNDLVCTTEYPICVSSSMKEIILDYISMYSLDVYKKHKIKTIRELAYRQITYGSGISRASSTSSVHYNTLKDCDVTYIEKQLDYNFLGYRNNIYDVGTYSTSIQAEYRTYNEIKYIMDSTNYEYPQYGLPGDKLFIENIKYDNCNKFLEIRYYIKKGCDRYKFVGISQTIQYRYSYRSNPVPRYISYDK